MITSHRRLAGAIRAINLGVRATVLASAIHDQTVLTRKHCLHWGCRVKEGDGHERDDAETGPSGCGHESSGVGFLMK